jgi:hypothetical protein
MRVIFAVLALSGLALFGVAVFQLLLWSFYNEAFWVDLVRQQVPAMIGLPAAAVASLGLVLLLENTSGAIEFEAVGLKFRGASGPIILWAVCFLAISMAIKLTWL